MYMFRNHFQLLTRLGNLDKEKADNYPLLLLTYTFTEGPFTTS